MQPPPHRVGLHPNPHQIVAPKAIQSLFPADSHTKILRQPAQLLRPCAPPAIANTHAPAAPAPPTAASCVTAAVFSSFATRSSTLSTPSACASRPPPSSAICALCSCNWPRNPALRLRHVAQLAANVPGQRRHGASMRLIAVAPAGKILVPRRHQPREVRQKFEQQSGPHALVYVFRQHRAHRRRPRRPPHQHGYHAEPPGSPQ